MKLCKFSKSEILADQVITVCPLGLKSTEAKYCACKTRRYNVPPADLRVIECTFPKWWNGKLIDDPEAYAKSIRRKREIDLEKKRVSKAAKEQKTMATAPAEAAKDEVPPFKVEPEKTSGIWGPNPQTGNRYKIEVVGVCGEFNSGKTLFVSSIDPENTCIVDCEASSASFAIPYKRRWSLYDEAFERFQRPPKPIEVFLMFRDFVMDEMQAGEYTVLAIDPITDLEAGLADWVRQNPEEFGHTHGQYEKMAGIMWGDVKNYWKMLLGIISRKVETLAFTAHMGDEWKGSGTTGRRKARGKETLQQLASLYVRVVRDPDPKTRKVPEVPAGVLMKSRLATSSIDEKTGEWVHHPILPPRIPKCSPAAIREYIKNPPNYSKLREGEKVQKEELSEDQKLLIKREIAEAELLAEKERNDRMESMRSAAKRTHERLESQNKAAAKAVQGSEEREAEKKPQQAETPEPDPTFLGKCTRIEELFGLLNVPEEARKGILWKRNAKVVTDLSDSQADEIIAGLEKKLNSKN